MFNVFGEAENRQGSVAPPGPGFDRPPAADPPIVYEDAPRSNSGGRAAPEITREGDSSLPVEPVRRQPVPEITPSESSPANKARVGVAAGRTTMHAAQAVDTADAAGTNGRGDGKGATRMAPVNEATEPDAVPATPHSPKTSAAPQNPQPRQPEDVLRSAATSSRRQRGPVLPQDWDIKKRTSPEPAGASATAQTPEASAGAPRSEASRPISLKEFLRQVRAAEGAPRETRSVREWRAGVVYTRDLLSAPAKLADRAESALGASPAENPFHPSGVEGLYRQHALGNEAKRALEQAVASGKPLNPEQLAELAGLAKMCQVGIRAGRRLDGYEANTATVLRTTVALGELRDIGSAATARLEGSRTIPANANELARLEAIGKEAAAELGRLLPRVGKELIPYLAQRAYDLGDAQTVTPEMAKLLSGAVALDGVGSAGRDLRNAFTNAAFSHAGIRTHIRSTPSPEVKPGEKPEGELRSVASTFRDQAIPGFVREVYVADLSSVSLQESGRNPAHWRELLALSRDLRRERLYEHAKAIHPEHVRAIPAQVRARYDIAMQWGKEWERAQRSSLRGIADRARRGISNGLRPRPDSRWH